MVDTLIAAFLDIPNDKHYVILKFVVPSVPWGHWASKNKLFMDCELFSVCLNFREAEISLGKRWTQWLWHSSVCSSACSAYSYSCNWAVSLPENAQLLWFQGMGTKYRTKFLLNWMSKMPHNNGRSKQGQCHLLATSMIWQDAVLPQQMHSQAGTCIQQYNTSFEEVNVFKLVKACSNLLCPWGSLPKRKLLNKHCWGALTRLLVTFGKHLLFFLFSQLIWAPHLICTLADLNVLH